MTQFARLACSASAAKALIGELAAKAKPQSRRQTARLVCAADGPPRRSFFPVRGKFGEKIMASESERGIGGSGFKGTGP